MRGVLKDSIGRPTIHSLRTRLSEMREGSFRETQESKARESSNSLVRRGNSFFPQGLRS